MKSRVQELIEQGDRIFAKRRAAGLEARWQTMAENFNPIRADFTRKFKFGDEFASDLMTGRPLLAQRDLGNALASMLRPRGTPWFHARTNSEKINKDATGRQYLDYVSDVMRTVMYDQRGHFLRATKDGDNDFVTFGQCVILPELKRARNGILYRCFHLRDTVWCENAEQEIDRVDRNWQVEALALSKLFPGKLASAVSDRLKDDPYLEVKCRHIVLPADDYDLGSYENKRVNRARFPFVSIYVDCDNDTILEEVPRRRLGYVIPRWVTPSGTQYAHSPATTVSLPEARLLQQITLTLLEAGQKAVDPPMKATREGIAGGVNLFPGGVTWADAEYDERLGKALEPVWEAPTGLSWGDQREEKIEQLIKEAFFLNVITLPDVGGPDMTAYEVQKRIEEYIRRALPLFEPMEVEYNGGLCEETFNILLDHGTFGPDADVPQILKGQDVRWQFESPLQAATERGKAQAFVQSTQLLKTAAELDPMVRHDFNLDQAFRDALPGAGAPADWIVPEKEAAAAKAQDAQRQALEQQAAAIAGAGQVAQHVGAGAKSLQDAGLTQPA